MARHGLTPERIDMVIHTHLHNDHCENDYKCTNAEIFVHPKELARIHDPHPLDFRYVEDYIEDVEENGQIRLVEADGEIVDGIRVMHTPAHTEGGLTVLVETFRRHGGHHRILRDQRQLFPPKQIRAMEMDVIPPGTHVNAYEAYDIMIKVKGMADILLPLHEPAFADGKPIP
jgi:N-acyl homoserine lactone hydrolase